MATVFKEKKKKTTEGKENRRPLPLPHKPFRIMRQSSELAFHNKISCYLRLNKVSIMRERIEKKAGDRWRYDKFSNIPRNSELWKKVLLGLKGVKRLREALFAIREYVIVLSSSLILSQLDLLQELKGCFTSQWRP